MVSSLQFMSVSSGEGESSTTVEEITLTAVGIPGAELAEPLDKHPVAALRWWLLCRGIKVPNSTKKKDLVDCYKFPGTC